MSSFLHKLTVTRTAVTSSAENVAIYLLHFLTLDLIDEKGQAPVIPFEASSSEDGLTVTVKWNHPFTYVEVEEMCKITLPDQLVGLETHDEEGNVTEVIERVWYDDEEVIWVVEDEEEE